ncbi:MAG: sigma 54-interacting transcriptional regulator, partial [Mucispirillum sp.]|nr:sigma 54-interacting transcriptional regulator [Mucispirillum sp.]
IVHKKNVNELLNRILSILSSRLNMIRGVFTIIKNDILYIEAGNGIDAAAKKQVSYKLGEGIIGHVAETGKPHLIEDVLKDPRFLNRAARRNDKEKIAFICVPIIYMERVVGTLSVDKVMTDDCSLDKDLKFLEIIGNIVGEAVTAVIAEHEEKEQMISENRHLRDMLDENSAPSLIGNCKSMRNIYALIKQVADSEATVLLRGSSGTGKEMAARAIVALSSRKNKPFITLNCAAIPENLVESELFGHEKGTFTGAVSRRIGHVEKANTGTLFLDEVGDLSLASQVKLLRFIQERTFTRLGSSLELKSDVRIIAATSRNLEEMISDGLFREDLYYRLNVFPIIMPDLNARKSDIILLAEHFIEKHNIKYKKHIKRLSTPAINMMMSYHWPGNVRELENCIERAVITAAGDCIHGYNLPASLQTGTTSNSSLLPDGEASFNTLVDSYERELIVEALKKNNGNMSAAARKLGLSPRVIHYKIRKLGITPEWYIQKKSSS